MNSENTNDQIATSNLNTKNSFNLSCLAYILPFISVFQGNKIKSDKDFAFHVYQGYALHFWHVIAYCLTLIFFTFGISLDFRAIATFLFVGFVIYGTYNAYNKQKVNLITTTFLNAVVNPIKNFASKKSDSNQEKNPFADFLNNTILHPKRGGIISAISLLLAMFYVFIVATVSFSNSVILDSIKNDKYTRIAPFFDSYSISKNSGSAFTGGSANNQTRSELEKDFNIGLKKLEDESGKNSNKGYQYTILKKILDNDETVKDNITYEQSGDKYYVSVKNAFKLSYKFDGLKWVIYKVENN
jgi:hypothetical protein